MQHCTDTVKAQPRRNNTPETLSAVVETAAISAAWEQLSCIESAQLVANLAFQQEMMDKNLKVLGAYFQRGLL